MKHISVITSAIALAFILLSHNIAHAQKTGAYSNVSVKNAEVRKAAKFAITERSKTEPVRLVKIVHARRQVVAGMNYELALNVRSGKKTRQAKCVVYRKLDGTYELTSWE